MPKLNNIRLKICGLRDNISEVVDLQPDYAGFIFYDRSPRCMATRVAAEQVKAIPDTVAKVGVFVNQSLGEVCSTVKEFDLQYVQLHGVENVNYCKRLHAEEVKIIKVFSGNEDLNEQLLDQYAPFIDFYLFDTRTDKPGGTGEKFNWEKLRHFDLQKPVFLSGGIDLDNIGEIESLDFGLHAIDVNSRFEVEPGLKNIDLLKKLKNKMKSVLQKEKH
ncbi:Phosphoribosylanthranilate isomerase [Fulvivirga imtechensis AK7]|uniref:N-(5'-phosphoribosyl)anthranilate isomerase n=1 Tax=Fulvivirga imtechensis AK7 TaxID=1237149 RepID=L8JRQ3_9BACT|nr:phosphoribosylanthranilate isomerase [Fulvivirga imtechensis]ELR70868.1 Phosphoribosylanthranilate isomerase [Fulvivirga imtechensis AK7]